MTARGTTTESGYAELAALDSDGNGWIDEADPAFSQLYVWSQNGLASLAGLNTGALYANSLGAQMDYSSGTMKEASIFLREDGSAGTTRRIDIKT